MNILGNRSLVATGCICPFDTCPLTISVSYTHLHSTASSHKRVMVIEVMVHKAGWIALYSGMAGGGDVILVPEIPYSIKNIGNTILEMCIRDRDEMLDTWHTLLMARFISAMMFTDAREQAQALEGLSRCLLYTSWCAGEG